MSSQKKRYLWNRIPPSLNLFAMECCDSCVAYLSCNRESRHYMGLDLWTRNCASWHWWFNLRSLIGFVSDSVRGGWWRWRWIQIRVIKRGFCASLPARSVKWEETKLTMRCWRLICIELNSDPGEPWAWGPNFLFTPPAHARTPPEDSLRRG